MELSGFSHQSQSFVLLINVKMPTIVGILTFMSRINFMLGWAESEKSFTTLGPSVHVSGTRMSYMLLLVLFSILSFGFLFFHVHHLCMPLLGPELVNKILVSCILYLVMIFISISLNELFFLPQLCQKIMLQMMWMPSLDS